MSKNEDYTTRMKEWLNKLSTMSLEERKVLVLQTLSRDYAECRSWTYREDFWPNLIPVLDALVAEGRVRERTVYEYVPDHEARFTEDSDYLPPASPPSDRKPFSLETIRRKLLGDLPPL